MSDKPEIPPTTDGEDASAGAQILAGLFAFEQRGRTRFRTAPTASQMARLYGGQVIAQALDAARRTVEDDRVCHSLHGYFVRAGNPRQPIDLAVSCDADSRSFSARRVTARQDRTLIFSLSASFQRPADGPRVQVAMPEVPAPESLANQQTLIDRLGARLPEWAHPFWRNEQAVEYRFCETFHVFRHSPEPPARHIWMRVRLPLPADPHVHQRMLAYASDLHILHTGLLPLGWVGPTMTCEQRASITRSGFMTLFALTSGCCTTSQATSPVEPGRWARDGYSAAMGGW